MLAKVYWDLFTSYPKQLQLVNNIELIIFEVIWLINAYGTSWCQRLFIKRLRNDRSSGLGSHNGEVHRP